MSKENQTRKAVFVYKKNWGSIFYVFCLKLIGYEIYYWQRNPKDITRQNIPFPEAGQYHELTRKAGDHLDNYFKKFMKNEKYDKYLLYYLEKSLFFYDFVNYYFFEISIRKHFHNIGKTKIVSDWIMRRIFNQQPISINIFLIAIYLMYAVKAVLVMFRSVYLSVFKSSKVASPSVIYIRKKLYPDMLDLSKFQSNFTEQDVAFESVYFMYSNFKKKDGIYFLNSFIKSRSSSILSMIRTLQYAAMDARLFIKYRVPYPLFYSYLINSFYALSVIHLRPKVIFGILVDKPYFILLYRYKLAGQKICSFADGFVFPPDRGPDYCCLDVYYSMNQVEASTVNSHGGEIKRIKMVGFLRSENNVKVRSNGISEDLNTLISQYNYRVLITTMQIATDRYYSLSLYDFNSFLKKILEIARKYPETLFIIKGKKGELNYMPKEFFDEKEKCQNVYIVHSDKPRLLAYNHFEDLIKNANLVISMANNSMTIFQALSHNIPVIAYNNSHSFSFLHDYKHVECRVNDIETALNYWKDIDNKEFVKFRKDIGGRINLDDGDGLKAIVEDMCSLI